MKTKGVKSVMMVGALILFSIATTETVKAGPVVTSLSCPATIKLPPQIISGFGAPTPETSILFAPPPSRSTTGSLYSVQVAKAQSSLVCSYFLAPNKFVKYVTQTKFPKFFECTTSSPGVSRNFDPNGYFKLPANLMSPVKIDCQ